MFFPSPISNKQLREQARLVKVQALFELRHAKYPTQDHTTMDLEPSVGDYHRARCRRCDVVINFREDDLDRG